MIEKVKAMTDPMSPSDQDSAFVTVVFAEDYGEAEYYKSLLEDHGIEVHIGEDTEGVGTTTVAAEEPADNGGQGVPVMVMYENLADAENIIDRVSDADEEFDSDEEYDDSEEDEFADFGEFDPDEQ